MDTGITGSGASVDEVPHNLLGKSQLRDGQKGCCFLTIGRRVETMQEFRSVKLARWTAEYCLRAVPLRNPTVMVKKRMQRLRQGASVAARFPHRGALRACTQICLLGLTVTSYPLA